MMLNAVAMQEADAAVPASCELFQPNALLTTAQYGSGTRTPRAAALLKPQRHSLQRLLPGVGLVGMPTCMVPACQGSAAVAGNVGSSKRV